MPVRLKSARSQERVSPASSTRRSQPINPSRSRIRSRTAVPVRGSSMKTPAIGSGRRGSAKVRRGGRTLRRRRGPRVPPRTGERHLGHGATFRPRQRTVEGHPWQSGEPSGRHGMDGHRGGDGGARAAEVDGGGRGPERFRRRQCRVRARAGRERGRARRPRGGDREGRAGRGGGAGGGARRRGDRARPPRGGVEEVRLGLGGSDAGNRGARPAEVGGGGRSPTARPLR